MIKRKPTTNIISLIDNIKLRIYWIERTRYMLTPEQILKLKEVAKVLAEIESDVSARA